MTNPASELQAAIHARLTGDAALTALLGGAKVFDHEPADAAFPYINFGDISVFDWSTDTDRGAEQIFSLNVWSKGRGKKEALAVMERVAALIDGAPPALATHHLVSLEVAEAETGYDADLAVQRGTLRLRAIIERAA